MSEQIHESLLMTKTPEESLLASSRTGDIKTTTFLLNEFSQGKINLNINCIGEQKSNHGWTPLHLACYFGHEGIADLLIKHGADINIMNDTGDTALHKAAYTGREELVLSLLKANADVFIKNSEGQTARDICKNAEIKKLLKAAEDSDVQKKNSILLHAAREGDTEKIQLLLKDNNPPDINCVDSLGNSALHCAAYRGKKEVAVMLLQNGIDTSILNYRGQKAIDLALNLSMKQILAVQPVKRLQKTATRFEGLLLRKSRFLGWREVWAVLERGVMSFFTSRADATTGSRRKGYKYLDGAQVLVNEFDAAAFTIVFSNRGRQRFSVPFINQQQVDRQKWVNAITEHIEFSSHYLQQTMADSDPEEDLDVLPLGTMQDKLQTAQAHQRLLEKNVETIKKMYYETLSRVDNGTKSPYFNEVAWNSLHNQFENLIESAHKVSSSLSHCLTIFSQQEEVRLLQLKQEQERCRVLQDALHALAQEHHELEKSFVSPFHSPPNSPHYPDTDCDEFFDAFEGDYSSPQNIQHDNISNSDTIVPDSELFASLTSSPEIVKPLHSKWGRPMLSVPSFSRNDFSVWSILKQCIGKELSKITMPVVFNEPLSLLQRLCENMEYAYLLEKANTSENPIKRMEYVSAFAIAAISSNWERLGKPFNPLLGETYELVSEDESFRIVTEQVSHHPPISAFHADSPHFIFSGAMHPKLKLWARSVEIKPEGTVMIKLLNHNEIYTWTGVTTCVHNIIVGKLWMEQCGTMEIKCHTNGLTAELNFKPAGWFSKDLNCVEGFILDRQKSKLSFIYGDWSSHIRSLDPRYYETYIELKNQKPQLSNSESRLSNSSKDYVSLSDSKRRPKSVSLEKFNGDNEEGDLYKTIDDLPSFLLWEVEPRPHYSSEYYNFTLFAMALNELKSGMETILPPTDSRLRPDIRKLEEGDVDGAAFEKDRLEEKQREARRVRKRERTTWSPLWFELKPHPYIKEETWSYKGKYWERDFIDCPDIF